MPAMRSERFPFEDILKRKLSQTATTRDREKLPTLVLEKLGWVCPRSSSPCFFAYCNFVVVKSERQRISLWNLILFDYSRSSINSNRHLKVNFKSCLVCGRQKERRRRYYNMRHHLVFLHTDSETSSSSKQKENVDPCEFCGFVVGRKGDIWHHAKWHAPDSEYVVFCAFFSFCLDM